MGKNLDARNRPRGFKDAPVAKIFMCCTRTHRAYTHQNTEATQHGAVCANACHK